MGLVLLVPRRLHLQPHTFFSILLLDATSVFTSFHHVAFFPLRASARTLLCTCTHTVKLGLGAPGLGNMRPCSSSVFPSHLVSSPSPPHTLRAFSSLHVFPCLFFARTCAFIATAWQACVCVCVGACHPWSQRGPFGFYAMRSFSAHYASACQRSCA